MKRNRIRLTESDLHKIVKESVNRVLNEKVYDKVPWSEEDTEEGRNTDWEYYQSNPWGNFGKENFNLKNRNGELAMAALSDVPSLKALGRNGATTPDKFIDAQDRYSRRHWVGDRTVGGDFFLNSPQNRAIQQYADKKKKWEMEKQREKMAAADKRWQKASDKRPLNRKGSLNREL